MKRAHLLAQLASLCLILVIAAPAPALAQGSTSRVTGTVLDASGAAVPGATVTLTNEATQVSFTTETTSTGTYVFEAVQVGVYTVAVELQGFSRFASTGNAINANQPATVDVTLQPGNLSETVTVSGSAELVQTSTSGNFGNTVEERPLQTLPIVGTRGRNPLSFINFQPGVVTGTNTGGGVIVHGSRDRAFNFTLDGIDANDTSAGGDNSTPVRTNPDAITQFQIITSGFTAETGRSSGAQVTLVTKSGTNEFHGNLFEFYQTPRLHANDYSNTINTRLVNGERVPGAKPQFVQNIYGGSIGGPVYLPRFGEGGKPYYSGKNRTFFFANLQMLRTAQSVAVTRTVYTQQARQGLFRYATSGRNNPSGVAGASVDINGNPIVPLATFSLVNNPSVPLTLDPTVQSLLALTPLPNNFTTGDGLNTAGFTFVGPQTERQYDFTTKIDHSFNDSNSIYVRYSRGSQNTLCDNVNGGLPSFPGLPCTVDTFRSPRNLAVNYRATLTPTVVNEFIAGFNRFTFSFNNPDPNADVNPPIILNLVRDPLNSSPAINNARRLTTYQFVDNLSWAKGAHSYKFGANLRFQSHLDDRSSVAGFNTRESATLSTTINPVPTSFGTGTAAITNINSADRSNLNSFINDLLGRVGRITQAFVATDDGSAFAPAGTRFFNNARFPELDFYAQDSWKLRPNLTVDYGLRYEVRLSPTTPGRDVLVPDRPVRVGETPTDSLRFVPGKFYDDSYRQLAPTAGFAWDPFNDGKSSVRANYRLAYDRLNTFVFSSFIFPNLPGATRGITNDTFGASGGLLRSGLPVLTASDRTPEQFRQPPAFSNNVLTVVDPDLVYPRTHQFSVGFQREIGFKSVIEVNYIGRKGSNLLGGYDVNQVDITGNGFLDAFNALRAAPANSPLLTDPNFLINRLLRNDSRLNAGETGAQFLRRFTPTGFTNTTVALGSVATAAALIAQGTQRTTGVSNLQANNFPLTFFQPYPQFAGALNVLDSNDRSRYHALEVQLSRRFSRGLGFQISYTLAKSEDTRSFDPTFAIANRGSVQSAANTPFDVRNRDLNYARSDFDRRHAVQGYFTYEVPFGRGRSFASDLNPALDRLIGGFEVAGIVRRFSGRPFTVYAGTFTVSNVVQATANCNGCSPDMGRLLLEGGRNFFFDEGQRAMFSAPGPGEQGNTGRNYFTGPSFFQLDVTLGKRIRFDETRNLELRIEAQNATNTPSFDFPTAVITSSTFGRINDAVVSSSRRVQLAAKFNF